jgi:hypothetical protein
MACSASPRRRLRRLKPESSPNRKRNEGTAIGMRVRITLLRVRITRLRGTGNRVRAQIPGNEESA